MSIEGSPASWYQNEMWNPKAEFPRADSHIHLVKQEHRGWASARGSEGTVYDEPVLYNNHASRHGVEATLVVAVSADNNAYVAEMATQYAWCRPLASINPAELTLGALEGPASQLAVLPLDANTLSTLTGTRNGK